MVKKCGINEISKDKRLLLNDSVKKAILIAAAVLAGVLVLLFLIRETTIGSREAYRSESLMREAMQGRWTHDSLWQWVIEGDTAYKVYADFGQDFSKNETKFDITWNSAEGAFYIGKFYIIVEKGGDSLIEDGEYIYKRGGFLKHMNMS